MVAGLAFALSGCLSPKTSGSSVEKGRLIIEDASFALNLSVERDAMERTPEGLLHVQVDVQNTNQRDYNCQYRFQWFTKDGMLITHERSQWRPLLMHGREKTVFEAVSTVKGAEDFRLVMRRSEEVK